MLKYLKNLLHKPKPAEPRLEPNPEALIPAENRKYDFMRRHWDRLKRKGYKADSPWQDSLLTGATLATKLYNVSIGDIVCSARYQHLVGQTFEIRRVI